MDDKRKYRRFYINLPAMLGRDDKPAISVPVTVIDVSSGGVGLVSPEEIPVGTQITLSWDRPPFALSITEASIRGTIVGSQGKPTQPGKFTINTEYIAPASDVIQQLLRWSQMQSLIKAKASTRTNSILNTSNRSFKI